MSAVARRRRRPHGRVATSSRPSGWRPPCAGRPNARARTARARRRRPRGRRARPSSPRPVVAAACGVKSRRPQVTAPARARAARRQRPVAPSKHAQAPAASRTAPQVFVNAPERRKSCVATVGPPWPLLPRREPPDCASPPNATRCDNDARGGFPGTVVVRVTVQCHCPGLRGPANRHSVASPRSVVATSLSSPSPKTRPQPGLRDRRRRRGRLDRVLRSTTRERLILVERPSTRPARLEPERAAPARRT